MSKVISDYYAKTKEEFKSYHRGVVEELLVSCHGQQVLLEDALCLENTSKAGEKGVLCHVSKSSR